jgi:hypothetical protein
MTRTEIHLLDGTLLHVGDECLARHSSRWCRAKVCSISQGTGVERAFVVVTGKCILKGRYDLRPRLKGGSDDETEEGSA